MTRRQKVMVGSIAMSCGLTAIMSLVFNGRLRTDMLVTGFVCALVIDRVIDRISGGYRRKLAEANQRLEQRVRERTAELEQAREELMIRDRMATAGMLSAAVCHEIRSPLSVIRIAVDEVVDAAQLSADARAMLADVSDATERIAMILRDLSSLARPVDDPLGAVALDDVVAAAARLASYRLGPTATLERVALDVPAVIGNAPRLVQLVLNLVVNAARASRPDAANVIRVSAESRKDSVVLAVADTGIGMSADTRARLFEPFFTTGTKTGGTGLGLTICRSLVERMGGSIAIDSELGRGTTVRVTLQRATS